MASSSEESVMSLADMQKAAWWACVRGDVDTMRSLREKGLDMNFRPLNAWQMKTTCLHKACMHKHEALASFLIQEGADVNAEDSKNRDTPLHEAARYGSAGIVASLVAAGANVAATNNDGLKPKDVADTRDIRESLVQFELRAAERRNMELEDQVSQLQRQLEKQRQGEKSASPADPLLNGFEGNTADVLAAVRSMLAARSQDMAGQKQCESKKEEEPKSNTRIGEGSASTSETGAPAKFISPASMPPTHEQKVTIEERTEASINDKELPKESHDAILPSSRSEGEATQSSTNPTMED